MNKVILIGNTGTEIDVHTFDNGEKKASFSLATNESYTKDGNKIDAVEWHKIIMYGKTAEIVEQYVKKGDKLAIEGKIKTREYEVEGQKRYATEINAQRVEMLGSKKDNQ
jgi:single-strand DNA-binding protein